MLDTSALEIQYYLPPFIEKNLGLGEKLLPLPIYTESKWWSWDHMWVQSHLICSKTHILFNIYWSHTVKPTPVLHILSMRYLLPSSIPLYALFNLCLGLNWSFPATVTVTLIFHLCQLSSYYCLSTSYSPYFPSFVIRYWTLQRFLPCQLAQW